MSTDGQKTAIITGGYGGIGTALSTKLIEEGYHVLVFDMKQPQTHGLNHDKHTYIQQDITDRESFARNLDSAFEKHRVELVIANAGVDIPQSFENFDWQKGVLQMDINTTANIILLKKSIDHFRARGGGHFVGISSLGAFKSFPFEGTYCASKIALKYLIDSARSEFLDNKTLHFTTVFPGYVQTPMLESNAFDVKSSTSADKAAARIYSAIQRKAPQLIFPKNPYFQMWIANLLPLWLQDRLARTATKKSKLTAVGAATAVLLFAMSAFSFKGTVQDSGGNPIPGVMATFTDAETKNSITTYTDENGRFDNSGSGKGTLRFRHYKFADLEYNTEENQGAVYSVKMEVKHNLTQISDSVPAVYHATELYKNTDKMHRAELVSQCMMCHQLGNKLTRTPRSLEAWDTTVARMEGMASLLTFSGRKEIVNQLHQTFDGEPVKINELPTPENHLHGVEIKEWPMATGISHIHDIVTARNGMIYGVDMSLDELYILNPQTNEVKKKKFPKHPSLPMGGVFSGAVQPLGTMGATWGPHSLQEDSKGVLWITCSLSGDLLSYNPETEAFNRVPVDGVYPHTLRIKDDVIWFTIAISNQVGRYDINKNEMKIIDLPSGGIIQFLSTTGASTVLKVASWFPGKNLHLPLSMHKISGQGFKVLPLPYGIDFHPVDGSVWYSKLNAGKIGRIDPQTFNVQEWETPKLGPRRLRFSKDGNLWIPAFLEGALMSYDTVSGVFKSFMLPTFEDAQIETPYALNIHPETQHVWMTGGLSDRLIEFNPKERRFKAYPLPTQVTFMREIEFLNELDVCSSYANLPAHAIEGGVPKVFCLSRSPTAEH